MNIYINNKMKESIKQIAKQSHNYIVTINKRLYYKVYSQSLHMCLVKKSKVIINNM